jgi:cell division protein ZapA
MSRKINLLIAGINYPLTVENEKEEELAREATKQVNLKLKDYRGSYQRVDQDKILPMVAFHFALNCLELKERNDTRPYTEKVEELTGLLEEHFRNE